jgi:hypothetical protein
MNGLHSCKPGNEPTVGETKHFTIEQRVGKSGKPWTKIKAAAPDAGGQSYRVKSVKPTDYTDQHGNVSMNLEIEPANGVIPIKHPSEVSQYSQAAPQRAAATGASDDRSNRIERQHSQEMALRYFAIWETTNITTAKLRDMIDWFQRDVGRMPAPPQAKPEPEPEHDDAPEPDEEEAF